MRALLYRSFGPPEVLEIGSLPDPRPRPGEVLVRVAAAALNPKDILVRKGKFALFTGRTFPKVPGYDLAGEVVALGRGVTRFAHGDLVFGMLQRWSAGATAELCTVPTQQLAKQPRSLEATEAAAIPLASLTALQALRDIAQLQSGERLLINGASGGVGVSAIQIARIFGAHVTTTSSATNLELCQNLGASEVLDYRSHNPLIPKQPYDVVFDVFGNSSIEAARSALGPNGRYVTTIPSVKTIRQDLLTRFRNRPARLVVVRSNSRDLEQLSRWLVRGQLTPVIDRVLPLEAGAEAQAYIETKRARGKVVLTL